MKLPCPKHIKGYNPGVTAIAWAIMLFVVLIVSLCAVVMFAYGVVELYHYTPWSLVGLIMIPILWATHRVYQTW